MPADPFFKEEQDRKAPLPDLPAVSQVPDQLEIPIVLDQAVKE
jgi:hypothetical protein